MKNTTIALVCGLALVAATPALAKSSFLDQASSFLGAQTGANESAATLGAGLDNAQIGDGLKEALATGTKNVVTRLSKTGGFSADPKIRIPLPGALGKAEGIMKTMGFGAMTDDLDARMNRAAELAVPKAGALFATAIQKMTLTDARAILTGPNDAATQYLKKTTGADLAKEIQPVVDQTLAQAGAVKAYDDVMDKYKTVPFASSAKTGLDGYVTQKAMDGIFYYVAQEEAAIRKDPAKQTTALLKEVFGGK